MIHLKKKTPLRFLSHAEQQPTTEPCHCTPLSPLHMASNREVKQEEDLQVLAAPELNTRLRAHLQDLLLRIDTLSIILLHVSQVEPPPIMPPSLLPPKRQHYHASEGFLNQVMVNIRRVVREDDQILLQPGSGAALVLPHVDAQGAYRILERIRHSLDLLQAETVIPPLTRETTILLGSGSYPEQSQTQEQLLYATGTVAHHLTLRSALHLQWDSSSPSPTRGQEMPISEISKTGDATTNPTDTMSTTAPFMHLPVEIPLRLKQLIPYHLAQKLRCAPVGRDHQCLTVAMANPDDDDAVHSLVEFTGMTIFPVSCEEKALNTLLEKQW